MKILNANYQVIFSNNEKNIFSLGNTIKKFSFINKMTELFEISQLKNPSEFILSDDEKIIASLNTEGHISVFNANTGELIANTKALSQEGYGIYFTSNNRVITSTWEGNIIIFNFDLNIFDIINIPDAICGKLMPTKDKSVFLLFYNDSDKNNSLKIKEIDINKNTVKDIFSNLSITIEVKTLFCQNDNYYFSGSLNTLNDIICKFDYRKKQLLNILEIPLNIQEKSVVNCISVNKNETVLAIGYGNLYLYNLATGELLKEIETSYISCCTFFDSDKQLYIGTWECGFSITV